VTVGPLEPILQVLRKAPPELLAHSLTTARVAQKTLACLPPAEELRPAWVVLAALAHDLGKALWSDELFAKPSHFLTHANRALIHAHPVAGANLLREAWPDAPEEVVRAVLEHHERPGVRATPGG
jgi:putative nucleotidyltransferase with HDIG domain